MKLTIGTLEQGVKYVLLTLNIFHKMPGWDNRKKLRSLNQVDNLYKENILLIDDSKINNRKRFKMILEFTDL